MMVPHQIKLLAELSMNKKVYASLLLVEIVIFTSISYLSLVIVKKIIESWELFWKIQLFSTGDQTFSSSFLEKEILFSE